MIVVTSFFATSMNHATTIVMVMARCRRPRRRPPSDSLRPPPLPVLTRDRKGRLPLHAAALGGFPTARVV